MREERATGGRELERRDRKKEHKRDEGEEGGGQRRRIKGKEKRTGRGRKGRKRWWQVWIMG